LFNFKAKGSGKKSRATSESLTFTDLLIGCDDAHYRNGRSHLQGRLSTIARSGLTCEACSDQGLVLAASSALLDVIGRGYWELFFGQSETQGMKHFTFAMWEVHGPTTLAWSLSAN
jgi:hypothetical protein